MRQVQLSLTLGGYSDGSWHVSIIKTTYDRGRLESCHVVAQRVLTESQILGHTATAVQHMMDIESARRELTELADRTHSPGRPGRGD